MKAVAPSPVGFAAPHGCANSSYSGASVADSAAARSGAGGVSVLFVMKDSIYKSLADDCYDEQRDALTYRGDNPVVAHPPCQLWGKMANVNFARWGGEHNRPGSDGGKFAFALATVNRCGGVLEHPADSYAWAAHGLVRPLRGPKWYPSGEGWVCEVWQSAYGHRARKRTWLYFCGTEYQPVHPRWDMPEGTHQIGFHDQRGKARNKPTLSRREANATPESFANFLLALANTARCRRSTNASHVSRAWHPATLSAGGGGAEHGERNGESNARANGHNDPKLSDPAGEQTP